MKKKLIENTEPIKTRKNGWWITVQMIQRILVLNIYNNKILYSRHCINVDNYEYMTLYKGEWKTTIYTKALGLNIDERSYYYGETDQDKRFRMSKEDEELIQDVLKAKEEAPYRRGTRDILQYREYDRGRTVRENSENSRIRRISEAMAKVPETPTGIKEWINQMEIGGEDFATKTEKKGIYACSKCGEKFGETKLKRADGEKKIRNNDKVICPSCGKEITFVKRKKKIDIFPHFAIVQPIDDTMSVVRYFDAEIYCSGGKKHIGLDESIRILMFKKDKKYICSIYYNQYGRFNNWAPEGKQNNGCFDNKHNPANRKEFLGYLYDGGIEEAFKGTVYDTWTRLFKEFSAAGLKLNYNRMMCAWDSDNYRNVIEMLYRGRFDKLLMETSDNIAYWNMGYCGKLRISGQTIEDVFDIGDRQKINRIRDMNGGELMLQWMRWSDENRTKISEKTLSWLIQNNMDCSDMGWTKDRMSLEQGMNYIERQKKESYKGMSIKQIIAQYMDYLSMCEKLKKDLSDEMVYRPRELKRRHDEAVAMIAERDAELQADEFSRRFPGVEDILKEIKERFEYENDTYTILVPSRCVDIVAEGRCLHHCAGSSDRYFDRIKQRETYIVFLRKNDAPNVPYYTVEVEPGGTIRQHRGYLDEEPEIEEVKPFLREWQKVIRKRMTEEDHKHAAISAVKRIENIKELEAKNNTRVLNGLMEDFMEAI